MLNLFPYLWLRMASFAAASLLALASYASAEPIMLASVRIDTRSGHQPGDGTGRFLLSFPRRATLFEDNALSPDSAGKVFRAHASTEPDFVPFAIRATNGRPDFIEWLLIGGSGGGGVGHGSEASLFELPGAAPDFAGFRLTSLTLEVEEFTIVRPTPNFEEFTMKSRLSVFGEPHPSPIPEPATLSLFGAGLVAMRLTSRSRSRRRR